jgi:hypothetical protein
MTRRQKNPAQPPLDEAARRQLERSKDALDNVREGFDDAAADATPEGPASVSGGPRPRRRPAVGAGQVLKLHPLT